MTQQKIPADTIRASRLEIVDSEGRPRIVVDESEVLDLRALYLAQEGRKPRKTMEK